VAQSPWSSQRICWNHRNEAPYSAINALLSEAVKGKRSDIHIEPFETACRSACGSMGCCAKSWSAPGLAPVIVSRIKVMAKLDIAEKRLPQDGPIGLKLVAGRWDVRVSTLPLASGERVVFWRLLDQQAGRLEWPQLGMGRITTKANGKSHCPPHGIVR